MRAGFKLLTVLAVASFTAAGCGDDDRPGPGEDTTSDTTQPDGTLPDGTLPPDTNENVCGARECGVFLGEDCGTCNAGLVCNNAGRCEVPGQPLGAYCGVTATCHPGLPQGPNAGQWPGCQDFACERRTCLSSVQGAIIFRDVCSAPCVIYQDNNQDGINDEDAPQDDCNPNGIVDGPAGDKFRCVNFAMPGQSPEAYCVPGTTFNLCESDADCAEGESCDITNAITGGLNVGQRCIAAYRENDSWNGTVSGIAQSCDDAPRTGNPSYCGSGLCFGLGCVPLCSDDRDCDTTKSFPGTGCIDNKCGGTGKDCTEDYECSGWFCDDPRYIFGDGRGGFDERLPQFQMCWPQGCDYNDDCAGGFYCRFSWNGEIGDDAALANICLAEFPDGAELGDACDPNPNDNIPGPTCKAEDLCIGGHCSAICRDDNDCATDKGQLCGALELPVEGDDEEIEAVLPIPMCLTFPDATTDCLDDRDCAAGELCDPYLYANSDEATKAEAPFLLGGKCTPIDTAAFPGEAGDYGTLCTGGGDCKSGYCLGATASNPGFCTIRCGSSDACPDFVDGDDTYPSICNSYLYSWGGALNDPRVNINLNLCVPSIDIRGECSADFQCPVGQTCFPNIISWDPTVPSVAEYFCSDVWDVEDPEVTAPTVPLGGVCNPSADEPECISGICYGVDGSETVGYCTQVCDLGAETSCGNGTACYEVTRAPRRGALNVNSVSYGLCLQDPTCDPCLGHATCPGDYVCIRSAAPNAATDDRGYRCAPACDNSEDCGEGTCNTGTDFFGDAAQGCFELNAAGTAPAISCGLP